MYRFPYAKITVFVNLSITTTFVYSRVVHHKQSFTILVYIFQLFRRL